MSKLTVIANILSKEENVDELKSILEKLVVSTNKEKGCILYDLQQDISNSASFVMIEYWESKEALDLHMEQPHFKEFRVASENLIEDFSVKTMKHIK